VKLNQNNRGFTLIEMMVAVLLLIIGILGLYTMHLNALRSDVTNSKLALANRIVNKTIEEFRITSPGSNGMDSVTLQGNVFVRKWTVTNWPPDPALKQATIELGWGGSNCDTTNGVENCNHHLEANTIVK